jgi:hypothetical protein
VYKTLLLASVGSSLLPGTFSSYTTEALYTLNGTLPAPGNQLSTFSIYEIGCQLNLSDFFFFWQYWGLNSGLVLARLHHLSHIPALFASVIFLYMVLWFCPDQYRPHSLIYTFQVTGMTSAHHHTQLIWLGWP